MGEPARAPAPSAEALRALGNDAWARLVKALRGALDALDASAVTPELKRLRAAPTSALASGRNRDRVIDALRAGLWAATANRLDPARSEEIAALLRGEEVPAPSVAAPAGDRTSSEELRRAKERAREFQRTRDEAERRAAGAEARAVSAEQARDAAEAGIRHLRERVEELEGELSAADERRQREVDRAARQQAGEVARLEEEVRRLRRADEERRARRRRREAAAAAPVSAPVAPPQDEPRVVAGRPTRLPADLQPVTAEYAEALLTPGRWLFVDGYNVAKTHRSQLSPAEQRAWLLRVIQQVERRHGVDPVIFWDGTDRVAGSGSRFERFSRGDVTADDEIEFAVAAAPEDVPITVVTDDRELRGRVRAYGVDVVGTAPFLWAVD